MDKVSIAIISILVILGAGFFYFIQPKNINSQLSENQNSSQFKIENMEVKILKQGLGQGAKPGDKVTVDYVGVLENGAKFDSSIDRGQPFVFTLGQGSVIKGWDLGVEGMKIGEKRKLTIPPELAYGEAGAGDIIPPNSILIFEIDMLGIN